MTLPTFMRRIMYLGYYFKKLDWQKFQLFSRYYSKANNKNAWSVWWDMLSNSVKYNISVLEYFLFDFGNKSKEGKTEWSGSGYMYEYQLKMNPPQYREVLSDKAQFLRTYQDFVRHEFLTLEELENQPDKAEMLLQNSSGKVVLKSSDGQCGRGIEVRRSKEFNSRNLIHRLKETGNDLVEAFVTQHPDLMRLSPSGLNTVRIITQLDQQNMVHILGGRLRITINSAVDNLAAGNIAAPIDLDSGQVNGPGVYSDITKLDEYEHPITQTPIVGFQVPYWSEVLQMCRDAALVDTRNRSIGWDVAITEEGPELLEGNHNWCKLLWQLPVKKGLKPILEKFVQ
ncbi:MAG: hypothetical protein KI786_11605 [Mameliella sp.]|nr:hypothetical protein [Phaeodactylibacter sp.]